MTNHIDASYKWDSTSKIKLHNILNEADTLTNIGDFEKEEIEANEIGVNNATLKLTSILKTWQKFGVKF